MFRWYHDAAKCYVYLPDVSVSGNTWESAFQANRWFTRGWTLQELIAPKSVEFFSVEGGRLGNKENLEQQIHRATGIPIKALQASHLPEFTILDRMSWAKERRTQREEDMVYCLLGIVDVSISVIYGEGREKAHKRLIREIGRDRIGKLFTSLLASVII
jgi:hypothetical protein